MLEFPRWKVWLVSLVFAVGVLLSIPSLLASCQQARVCRTRAQVCRARTRRGRP